MSQGLTQEKLVYLAIKHEVDILPPADRAAVMLAYDQLKTSIAGQGAHGQLAVALLGAELSAQ